MFWEPHRPAQAAEASIPRRQQQPRHGRLQTPSPRGAGGKEGADQVPSAGKMRILRIYHRKTIGKWWFKDFLWWFNGI